MVTKAVVAFGPSNVCCMFLASLGPVRQWLTVRTNIPGGVLHGGISWTVKSKWLLGWQIYMWMPWPPCLYPAVSYGLGDHTSTFLNGHGISSKVGWFHNPCTPSGEWECSIPSLV